MNWLIDLLPFIMFAAAFAALLRGYPVAFTLASLVGRGARFFLVAILLWKFGKPIQAFIEKRLGLLTLLFCLLLAGGVIVLKVLT